MSKEIEEVKLNLVCPETRSQSSKPDDLYRFKYIQPDPKRRQSDRGERVAEISAIVEVKRKLVFEVYWYYWPHETAGGNQPFYAQKEIFATDDGAYLTPDDILDRCVVRNFHNYANYANMAPITAEDYLCRFTYDLSNGFLVPYRVPVFCKCEMPINPDQFMLKCVACPNRYHPSCLGMTLDEAKQLDQYVCCDKMKGQE